VAGAVRDHRGLAAGDRPVLRARVLVGPAGVLLTSVIYNKTNRGKRFVIVDAGMNDLLRPSLYEAEHEIVPVLRDASRKRGVVDVVGPVCESGDFLARDRVLPGVTEGELLAVLDAGAYGTVLGSNYNTRPRPAEVLVDGARAKVIRRRETFAEMVQGEMVFPKIEKRLRRESYLGG